MKIFFISLLIGFTSFASDGDPNLKISADGAMVTATGFDNCCHAHQNNFGLGYTPSGKGPATPGILQKGSSDQSTPAVDTGI